MLKKEQLSEMSNHELLCELVLAQQHTRLYTLILCVFCVIAAVMLVTMISSVNTALGSVQQTLNSFTEPAENVLNKISSLDVDAFNDAVKSLANTLARIPFIGN